MMVQYLMALLGAQRPGGMRGGMSGGDPLAALLSGLGAHESEGASGRWGDYVFNQEG
jgi:E3 ubiquitin-protein ligase RNF115/126